MDIPFNIDPEKVYTIDEISEIIRLERQTIAKSVRSGKLPAYKLANRVYRILGSDLITYIDACFVKVKK